MSKKLVESSAGRQKKLVDDQIETISFSFKYFPKKKYGLEVCDIADLKALVCQMKKLCSMTWNQVRSSPRHGLGTEKINSINEPIPPDCENNQLLAFRYNGKKPMVGVRKGSVFEILYLDTDFTLYRHS